MRRDSRSTRLLDALEARRISLGLSKAALCDRMGVDRSSVHRWIQRGAVPHYNTLVAWAEVLGLGVVLVETAESPPVGGLSRDGVPLFRAVPTAAPPD